MIARRELFPEAPQDDRWALAAGLAFLEGAATWGISGLRGWFQDNLVTPGYMLPPASVHEPPIGILTLWSRGAGTSITTANPAALLAKTRGQVLAGLRGFLQIPADDRFVKAALFSGRVQRASMRPSAHEAAHGPSSSSRWVPRPDPTAPLHAVVLSLFAIDVLTHRESWERLLCVCDACGRVTFEEAEDRRRACPTHGPKPSALMRKVTPP
ncbi:MAG: hypothetical protein QM820_27165 [Minicystis sp.]